MRDTSRRIGSLFLATLLVLAPAAIASASGYTLVDLGPGVEPEDVNNASVVVGSRDTGQYATQAVRYDAVDGLIDLPIGTRATGINDAGEIVGATPTGSFILTADGALTEWTDYGAYGINESGSVCGNKTMPNPYRPSPRPLAPAIYSAEQWDFLDVARTYPRGTRLGVYADLYVLNDINASGYAVGRKSRYGLFGSSAILITPTFDEVTFLATPNGGSANAINDQNLIVGATGATSVSGDYPHAYLYADGVVMDLGTLAGGLSSYALDINESNQVVGSAWLVTVPTSQYDPSLYHAFLWQDGTMADLNDELPAGSDWILTAATAVNDAGDVVGKGLRSGVPHGFLMLANSDADGDGIIDSADNCLEAANPDQRDSDGDGFGNVCDADLDNDGVVNVVDLGLLKQVFFSADEDADFNGDGTVNAIDLGTMKGAFFQSPGPSGVATRH